MTTNQQTFLRRTLITTLLVLLTVMLPGQITLGHAELDVAEPAPDALLAVPPDTLNLRFTEPVDTGAGSPGARLVDQSSAQIAIAEVAVDPADSYRVTGEIPDLGPGTYTVIWTTRSSVDGHTTSGSYAFRIGAGQAPGAATVEGESPAGWAVATRWLTFLGIAIAAGAFFFARIILAGSQIAAPRSLRTLALSGATVALAATLAEPFLTVAFPPAGAERPALGEAIRSVPDAWWFRPAGLTVTLLLALVWLFAKLVNTSAPVAGISAGIAENPAKSDTTVGDRASRSTPPVEWLGLAAALVALLGLSLTGHSAAETGLRQIVAVGSNVIHQTSTALWTGGLVALAAIAWPRAAESTGSRSEPVRRFSPWALGFVAVAVITGVINAGILLSAVSDLWESRYGVIILIKSGIVAIAVGLAAYHRAALRRSVAQIGTSLRGTLRAETTIVAIAIAVASTLALTAPPADEGGLAAGGATDAVLSEVVLTEPVMYDDGESAGAVSLRADPLLSAESNRLTVTMSDPDGAPMPIPDDARVLLTFESLLDPAIGQTGAEATPDSSGGFVFETGALAVDGWWRVIVTVRQAGVADLIADLYVVLPDPNLHGTDAVLLPESDPAAAALFERTREQFATTTGFRYTQTIASGSGTVVENEYALATADGEFPGGFSNMTDDAALVQVGDQQWIRTDEGDWIERRGSPFVPPAESVQEYDGATGFRLGRQEVVNGELSQQVMFYVPPERYAPAWYVWWVGVETGTLQQEAMVSRAHYMVKIYRDFNADITISAPDPADIVRPTVPTGG